MILKYLILDQTAKTATIRCELRTGGWSALCPEKERDFKIEIKS